MKVAELVTRLRMLEIDHEPDGWPAIQMKDVSALLNIIDCQRDALQKICTHRQGYGEIFEIATEALDMEV
jgi:hypothetical protein